MSRVHSAAPVPFTVPGGCQCDGGPHPDGDIVWFRPRLSADAGLAASALIGKLASQKLSVDEVTRELGLTWLVTGIVSWNFLDDAGKPIPVTEATIRYGLDWNDTAGPLSEFADGLYSEEAFAPLLASLPKSSPRGQTAASTSATSGSNGKPRTRSAPSSPTSSAATATSN